MLPLLDRWRLPPASAAGQQPLAQFGADSASTQNAAWRLTWYQPISSWMQLACWQPAWLAAEDEGSTQLFTRGRNSYDGAPAAGQLAQQTGLPWEDVHLRLVMVECGEIVLPAGR